MRKLSLAPYISQMWAGQGTAQAFLLGGLSVHNGGRASAKLSTDCYPITTELRLFYTLWPDLVKM